jgi:hypothetical protein
VWYHMFMRSVAAKETVWKSLVVRQNSSLVSKKNIRTPRAQESTG